MPLFSLFKPRPLLLGSAALALAATNALATWSILIVDMRTGEIVIASATCVETIDLRRETPVLITGVGAVTAQSAVDGSGRNRMLIRDRLLQGVPLESIMDELAQTDTGHGNRQYGFITADGHALTYSGVLNAEWAGGMTGRIERGELGLADDIVYSVQGNILSGPNVVQDAVDAIINTNSDLPGRLKAAMLAAQAGGGDGRCSCSIALPTSCGSPPPGPFKSAHVGYMLGTRADDIDSARAFYPITNAAGGMAILDINHDGMSDIVIGDASNNELNVFINTAQRGDPLSHVIPDMVINLDASRVLEMASGDMNNDGFDDLAIALQSPPTLVVIPGHASGMLGDPLSFALPGIPSGLDVGDMVSDHGDELVVSLAEFDAAVIYRLNNGAIEELGNMILNAPTGEVRIGQYVGDDLLDLAIALPNSNELWIGENIGSGNFQTITTLSTATNPIKIVASDITGSGTQELVVLSQEGKRAEVFAESGGSWILRNSIAINRDGRGLAVGHFNDDSFPDIITTSSSPQRNLQVFANDGKGGFSQESTVKVGTAAGQLELIDMNDNGDLDIVIGNFGSSGLMLIDNPRGTVMSNPGRFADGEYFLELNIANQRAADPDPVDQLVEAFDTWRAGLTGKVDAVRSTVTGRHRLQSGQHTFITIELRDWQGELLPITDPAWSLQSANGLFATFSPTLVEPGVFELRVSSVEKTGPDELIIRVGSGTDQVRMMPNYLLFFADNIADFTADGVLDFFDVSAYLHAFFTQSPDADLNGDGVFSSLDLSEFLAAFSQG